MNNIINNFSNTLINLDKWSDKAIKESIFGNLRFVKYFLPEQNKILDSALTVTLIVLFISLALPQFANDRFGIGIIILICFFFFLLNQNLLKCNFNIIDFLIIVFLLIATISTFSSFFFRESLNGLIKYFLFFLSYFIFKCTLLNSSQNKLIFLFYSLFTCAIAVSLIGIYQYVIGVEPLATWEDINSENIHSRVYSTLGNPNLLAGYLLPLLPFGIILPFKVKSSLFFKFLSITSSIIIFACIIFTGSRGGYIGLMASTLVGLSAYLISLFKSQNKRFSLFFLWIILAVLILIIVFLFPVFTERLSTIFTLRGHSSNSYRVNVWLSCLKMLRDNWIIGIGPGNNTFRLSYGLYMTSGFDALAAYNIFLEFAIETGFLGCLTFISIFLISFLKLHYIFWSKGDLMALGLSISLIAILIHGMFDTIFFRPQVFIPYWFLTAAIARLECEI